ncbi:YdbL family protein [Sphingobium sp. AR-3-1]|uniref:YdbL family protein n=1 Tax=Sphingobium psychrophilum TaxID=2728834 RepID=A0A7X9ZU09_9SPHN|nr:YdbL family protein [Sphingobium psychrophilum]NML12533.1 YdbL family protein [Sphingobium psychrophilum]
MTRKIFMFAAGAVIALASGFAMTAPARAQSGPVAAAMAAGTVGEQADGYLGIAGTVGADVRSEVESINIKRRAAYTQLAGQRGVTVQDVAAATGCQTLSSRVKQGQAYRIGAGAWQTKGAGAIALPGYCATAG